MSNSLSRHTGTLLFILLAHGCAYGIVGPVADPPEDALPSKGGPEAPPTILPDEHPGGHPAMEVTRGDSGVSIDLPPAAGRPVATSDAGLAWPDASAIVDIATPTILDPDESLDAPPTGSAENWPSDVPVTPDVGPARPPVRWLDIELDPRTNAECPGGWQVVVWGPTGAEVPSLQPPGERLHLMVPWSWLGVLRFGARCAIVVPARWRDWSPWLGQTVRAAGVRRITLTALDGVDRDLTDRSLICVPPAVRELHPSWPDSYLAVGEVALEPSLEGRCGAR